MHIQKIALKKIKFSLVTILCYGNIYLTETHRERKVEMTTWEKLENLIEQLGAEQVLDEVARALNDEKLNEVLNFIAKNWDVDIDGWECDE